PCRSPLRHVAGIVGRMDDCFRLPGQALLTPDTLRNAVLDASRAITDFRLIQLAPAEVQLILPPEIPGEDAEAAARAAARPRARPPCPDPGAAAAGAGQEAAPGGMPPARRGRGLTAAQAAAGAARTLTLRPSCSRATRNSTAIPPAIIAVSSRTDGPASTFATCAA